jgi:hypothetical protein
VFLLWQKSQLHRAVAQECKVVNVRRGLLAQNRVGFKRSAAPVISHERFVSVKVRAEQPCSAAPLKRFCDMFHTTHLSRTWCLHDTGNCTPHQSIPHCADTRIHPNMKSLTSASGGTCQETLHSLLQPNHRKMHFSSFFLSFFHGKQGHLCFTVQRLHRQLCSQGFKNAELLRCARIRDYIDKDADTWQMHEGHHSVTRPTS